MIEVLAALALAHPFACGQAPPNCPGPPNGNGGTPIPAGPPTYAPTLVLPNRVRVGEVVQIWAVDQVPGTLCYSDGSSKVGCAYTDLGTWHLVIRPGRVQYLTFRDQRGEVFDRRVYRNGRLVARVR